MSDVEVSKYRVVSAPGSDELEAKMNALVEEGYRFISYLHPPEGYGWWSVVMGLRSTPDLKMARDFVNLDIPSGEPNPLVAKMLNEGWVAIGSFSKHITLMKVKP